MSYLSSYPEEITEVVQFSIRATWTSFSGRCLLCLCGTLRQLDAATGASHRCAGAYKNLTVSRNYFGGVLRFYMFFIWLRVHRFWSPKAQTCAEVVSYFHFELSEITLILRSKKIRKIMHIVLSFILC